jgi:hypothetical protein
MMDFGGAIHCMIGGDSVYREAWASGIAVALQKPDDHSKMTRPFIYQTEGEGSTVPWVPSHEDMLANDWVRGVG